MASLTASLVILSNQPETWVCMVVTLVVTIVGIIALIRARQPETGEPV